MKLNMMLSLALFAMLQTAAVFAEDDSGTGVTKISNGDIIEGVTLFERGTLGPAVATFRKFQFSCATVELVFTPVNGFDHINNTFWIRHENTKDSLLNINELRPGAFDGHRMMISRIDTNTSYDLRFSAYADEAFNVQFQCYTGPYKCTEKMWSDLLGPKHLIAKRSHDHKTAIMTCDNGNRVHYADKNKWHLYGKPKMSLICGWNNTALLTDGQTLDLDIFYDCDPTANTKSGEITECVRLYHDTFTKLSVPECDQDVEVHVTLEEVHRDDDYDTVNEVLKEFSATSEFYELIIPSNFSETSTSQKFRLVNPIQKKTRELSLEPVSKFDVSVDIQMKCLPSCDKNIFADGISANPHLLKEDWTAGQKIGGWFSGWFTSVPDRPTGYVYLTCPDDKNIIYNNESMAKLPGVYCGFDRTWIVSEGNSDHQEDKPLDINNLKCDGDEVRQVKEQPGGTDTNKDDNFSTIRDDPLFSKNDTSPIKEPTTEIPTLSLTTEPTPAPTNNPTLAPTNNPTQTPTNNQNQTTTNNQNQTTTDNTTSTPGNSTTSTPGNNTTSTPGNNTTSTPGNKPTQTPAGSASGFDSPIVSFVLVIASLFLFA